MATPLSIQGLKTAGAAPPPAISSAVGGSATQPGKTPDGSPAAYQGPDQGPFECDNCEYFSAPSGCQKPEVLQEVGDTDGDGLADVDPKGCCNYFSKGGQ